MTQAELDAINTLIGLPLKEQRQRSFDRAVSKWRDLFVDGKLHISSSLEQCGRSSITMHYYGSTEEAHELFKLARD